MELFIRSYILEIQIQQINDERGQNTKKIIWQKVRLWIKENMIVNASLFNFKTAAVVFDMLYNSASTSVDVDTCICMVQHAAWIHECC